VEILDLFAKDSSRSVYAGKREVRPPAAPTTLCSEAHMQARDGVIETAGDGSTPPAWRGGLPGGGWAGTSDVPHSVRQLRVEILDTTRI